MGKSRLRNQVCMGEFSWYQGVPSNENMEMDGMPQLGKTIFLNK